ncbi:MAG: pentapeptide repeat protein [Solimicrobium sp.]|jgi:uncharacterized protein YjbI with pentapeptide repeats|nr:pentapeptide repeat protein [Solimicrobium sp.]
MDDQTRFVVETSTVVEYYEYSSHFLSKSLVTTLSTIFEQGYFESAEKSHSKMRILMGVIERNVGAVTLNLTGADLSGCSLQKADLSGADLSRANLSRACLYDADLSGANLSESTLFEANFEGCNLTKANFSATELCHATFFKANLSEANLSNADLSYSRLVGANLSKANLSNANLSYSLLVLANLSSANLCRVNLSQASVSGADFDGANLSESYLPETIKTAQLLNTSLIGAKCNNDDISEMIKEQEKEKAFKKYQLLSQIIGEFTFEKTGFPVELTNQIGRDLI